MTKDKAYPSRTAEQFVVRFPDGMRDKIAEAAKSNKRSMNAEIVSRLDRSFEPTDEPTDATLKEIAARMNESAVNIVNAAARVVASGEEINDMLEAMIKRSEKSLRAAVKAMETNDTSAATLEKLKRDLAGLQYFIEGIRESKKDDKP